MQKKYEFIQDIVMYSAIAKEWEKRPSWLFGRWWLFHQVQQW